MERLMSFISNSRKETQEGPADEGTLRKAYGTTMHTMAGEEVSDCSSIELDPMPRLLGNDSFFQFDELVGSQRPYKSTARVAPGSLKRFNSEDFD